MPATSWPELNVAVMVTGDISSSSPSGSDIADLCRFETNQDYFGEKHNSPYIKKATAQHSTVVEVEI